MFDRFVPIQEKWKKDMKQKGIRIALAVIEVVVGLGAIGGGLAILTGAFPVDNGVSWP